MNETQRTGTTSVEIPPRRGSTLAWIGFLALALIGGAVGPLVPEARGQENGESRFELSDQAITRAVDTELMLDEGVSAHLIDTSTREGIVTLTGAVDSLLAKERAAKLAQSIRGVRAVIDKTTVKASGRSDRETRADIAKALLNDPATDSYEVEVTVDDGLAILKGRVESWQEKNLAAQVAKGVKGVRAIQNDLTWELPEDRSDEEIKADIERRLRSDIWVDGSLIDVAVEDGQVRLSGYAGSVIEKNNAMSDAWVAGVTSVNAEKLTVDSEFDDPRQRQGPYSAQPGDEEIKAAIQDAFMYDPRVMSFNPAVEVENGVVTLTGVVDNLKAKRAAERDAHNTVGVWRVVNLLKVRPEDPIQDKAIEENLRDAIAADPYLERWELNVDVVNQKVYLSGLVDSIFEKNWAGEVTSGVKGVVAIENNLRVDYEPASYTAWSYYAPVNHLPGIYPWGGFRPIDLDRQIKERIESEYFWSPFVDGEDITVMVEDSAVTLSGSVDSRMEEGVAIDNAYQAGAVSVESKLSIEGATDSGG